MPPSDVIARASGVLSDTLEERAVLIPPSGTEVVTLSRTGSAIWDLLVEPRTRQEIELAVLATYPSEHAARIAADVAAFVEELQAGGFVDVTRS